MEWGKKNQYFCVNFIERITLMGDKKEIKQEEVISHLDDRDWFLQDFISQLNTSDEEMDLPITINVGGTIISGDLIGGKEYFQLFGKNVSKSFEDSNPELAKGLIDRYSKHGEVYVKKDDEEIPPPFFIHLKNARFYEAGQLPFPQNKLLWRGKLNSVDGFSFGKFEVE